MVLSIEQFDYQPAAGLRVTRYAVPTGNRYGPVNAFLLESGSEQVLLESGPLPRVGRDRLHSLVRDGTIPTDEIDRVILTHHHWDHVGGSLTIPEISELPHVVFREAGERILTDYKSYIGEVDLHFRTGQTNDAWYTHLKEDVYSSWAPLRQPNIDRVVEPGESIAIGDHDWTFLHTPGHEHNHMSVYSPDLAVLFLGDLTNERGYFEMGTTTSSIFEYVSTLELLADLSVEEVYLGHEPPIQSDFGEYVDLCVAQHEKLIDKILTAVEEGAYTVPEVATACFGDVKPSARPWVERITELYVEYIWSTEADVASLPKYYPNHL